VTPRADSESNEARSHALLDPESRRRKAQKLTAIVEARRALTGLRVLEVGTGSGVMAATIAEKVGATGSVFSVDVRDERVERDGFAFVRVGDTRLPFGDHVFDLAISNHVFEHVGDRDEQFRHLRELRRVVREDGLIYFAVPNRWGLLEPHYRLPFLSWFPQPAASTYLRVTRRGGPYDVASPSRRELFEIAHDAGLDVEECTLEAMRRLGEIEAPPAHVRAVVHAPPGLLRLGLPVVPTMVFLMRPRAGCE
jgi:ubiquinone/menaquinone biosynthesis C-methylase UbiE